MSYKQAVTPNPNIPCKPGWCLQYVRQAFGQPVVYPTATAAWEASKSQHRDRNFPPGLWVPVWYGLDKEPAGHVVLRAPNGNVYSTSDLSNTPHLHPDLADLERYYAYYGMTLTYRGWTEDVQGIPVITDAGSAAIAPQGAITTQEQEWDEMLTPQQIHEAVWGPADKSEKGAPFIYNNALKRSEYPRTVLGAMQDRIVNQQIAPLRKEIAAKNAQVDNLVSALSAVVKGEPFDQAKLLAGIEASAKKGAAEGAAEGVAGAIDSIDTTVTIQKAGE